VRTVLSGGIPDRVPLDDTYWETTIEKWRTQGLPEDKSPWEYFGTNEIIYIRGDYTMQFPIRVLEEKDTVKRYWDADGALRKDSHTPDGWTSQWLEFTIKNRDDWHKHRDQLTYNESRITPEALTTYEKARREERFVAFAAHACFHPTWSRIGMENELMLMLEEPDFISEMYEAHTRMVIDLFEGMRKRGMEFDAGRLNDDLGYHTAPLISPKLYRELVFPHHKRLCDHFADRGLKTMFHSDGNIIPLIDSFLDAGFSVLNPMEAKAGLDVRELKPLYGDRLVFHGNIDVRKLAGTKEEVEEEVVSKITIAKEKGGYIFHSDHSVPNNVPMENYRFAIELAKKHGSYT
jgi:uroporphyrinogen decarboxylase